MDLTPVVVAVDGGGSKTDVAALMPRRLAMLAEEAGRVVVIDSTGEAPPFTVGAVVRSGESGAVEWLLKVICDVAGAL